MSTNSVRIMLLTCSTRPTALGPAVAEWFGRTVAPLAEDLGVELVPVSLGELDLPLLDEEEHPSSGVYRQRHTREWSALVDSVDGVVAVTPEYNFGMPATLKNALDYLGREWAWKPIGFVSYGNTSAGTRSVQHAKQVVTTLRLVPLGATVALRIGDAVVDGRVRPDARWDGAAARVLGEVARLAQALRPLREAADDDAVEGPVPGSYLRRLTPGDAAEVVVLQRCCWVDEALANDTLALGPLHESLDDVRGWLTEWRATGLWRDGRLLGMVRTRHDDGTVHVGRLAVVPDLRGAGVGRWLLRRAQADLEPGLERVVLSTGARSERNLRLYESEGFAREGGAVDGVVRLGKPVPSPSAALAR
ncbi:GNAT family N-acetyltransferase [Isoptericola sp. NPDC058082]|uniref:GNAT family N-acetyltransferase n=1 Tax=Isoptericola sp. NPDC058082 TaxID=3346331 RepID=UPI0036E5D2AE